MAVLVLDEVLIEFDDVLLLLAEEDSDLLDSPEELESDFPESLEPELPFELPLSVEFVLAEVFDERESLR